jgi:KDO2-lipid IV(A) lauroyltransferase
MSRILYYVLLLPLSRLPLRVLYKLSDFLYLVLYRCLGYRSKVVLGNLRNSFPEKSAAEIKVIADEFYHYFCDQLVETIRLFSMPKEELLERCTMNDIALFHQYAKQGKAVLIAGGHYNNWELVAMGLSAQIPHLGVAIYHPLKNKFLNEKLQASRGRFGLELVPTKAVKNYFASNTQRMTATIFGTDQAPSNPHNAYWTMFLNQETPIFWGIERYAKEYNYPIVFIKVSRTGRGHFTVDTLPVCDQPQQYAEGEISELHTRILEKIILEKPDYWLWTHRRWKRTRPADVPLNGVSATHN